MIDKRLETLSDKVRSGIPITFSEALEVIEYQERLRVEREAKRSKTFIGRFTQWFCDALARLIYQSYFKEES